MKPQLCNNRYDQLHQAALLGASAFENNVRAPAQDEKFLSLLEGRKMGVTPAGEASTIELMEAWATAWHNQQVKAVEHELKNTFPELYD